jgi:hypothetical protein
MHAMDARGTFINGHGIINANDECISLRSCRIEMKVCYNVPRCWMDSQDVYLSLLR